MGSAVRVDQGQLGVLVLALRVGSFLFSSVVLLLLGVGRQLDLACFGLSLGFLGLGVQHLRGILVRNRLDILVFVVHTVELFVHDQVSVGIDASIEIRGQ